MNIAMAPKPKTRLDLQEIIYERIVRHGHACDLNDIDISAVTNFSQLLKNFRFQGDISKWNVSHVTNMHEMFARSEFNGDLSQWDVSSVTDMSYMFDGSKFDQDIAKWNVANVKTMAGMFVHAVFNQSLAPWDVSGVDDFSKMFYESPYEKDLNAWNPQSAKTMEAMLFDSAYTGQLSNWHPSPECNTDYLVDPKALLTATEPSFYHFKLIYGNNFHYENTLWEFVSLHRPVLDSMGLSAMQAAIWLNNRWKDGPAAFESLPAPEGSFG